MIYTKITILNRWMILIAIIFVLLFSSAFVYADSEELEHIRHAIKAKGARWHADHTSVSALSEKEKKLRLGMNDHEDFAADYLFSSELAPIPTVTAMPPTLDWRNVEGVSYVTPVKNQGACGSCWAFATTAALESQVMISTSGQPIDLSEQILVSCSGAGSCSGGSSATASNFLRDVGLPLENCFQYTATNNLCNNACLNWQDNTYSIIGWHRASTTAMTANDIKNALYAYGPVVASMYVYNDFYSYRSGVYSYTTGSYVGAHAVMVVGYDDTMQAFIVKNSWGSGWGETGYFMIAYSEIGGTSRFGYSVLVYDGYGNNPEPPPEPPPPVSLCSYSITPTSKNFRAAGGSASVTASTESGCAWTATSSASWLIITSGASGTGSGKVSYTVQTNTSTATRTAALTIGGQTFNVSQDSARSTRGRK